MLAALKKNGYVICPEILTSLEVKELVAETKKLLSERFQEEDFLKAKDNTQAHKILYPLDKKTIYLRYLVHPFILDKLLEFFPDPSAIILVWEDIMIKQAYSGTAVAAHQDIDQNIKTSWEDGMVVGINLHDSKLCPVFYLPGSHHLGALSPEAIAEINKERLNEFVPAEVGAGGMVIHSPLALHFSKANESEHERFTLYFVFRDMNIMRKYNIAKDKWLYAKQAIFAHALKIYQPNYFSRFIKDESLLEPYQANLKFKVPYKEDVTEFNTQSVFDN
jgi:ectoine hydroxylase-related dioxygenase (phytanoyl-CoA dioxygenase family)